MARTKAAARIALAAFAQACGASESGAPATPTPTPPPTYASRLLSGLEGAVVERTRGDLMAIGTAIQAWSASSGEQPAATDIEALAALLSPTYIHVLPRTDAWGNKLRFAPTAQGWALTAPGPDGVVGGEDDMVLTDRGEIKLPAGYQPNFAR